MYPIGLGYTGAKQRISDLLANGHDAEALVTAAFTVEKTLRRTLRQLIVSAGFRSTIADQLLKSHGGLDKIRSAWAVYDPKHRPLATFVSSADWNTVQLSATMRNKLVHGERVYPLAECRTQADDTLLALDRIKTALDTEYGYSGWTVLAARLTSHLHKDAKVLWT